MSELPIVDFTKLKKKRPQQQKDIINKFAESSELDDFVVKKTKKETSGENKENESLSPNQVNSIDGFQEYSYDFLLNRITNLIKKHNPKISSSERGPIKIPPPNIVRAGTSRSAWTNFTDICTVLNRPTEHLFQYILSELGVEGSLGGESQFILKGRYNNKHIESVLVKYIHDYIQCINCKSSNTVLKKDNSARLQVLACNNCGAERTVQPIKAGVKAGRK
jgi:translation initiation factor 2 subunit 2